MLKQLLTTYIKTIPSEYQVYLICLIILLPNILIYLLIKTSNLQKYKHSKKISNIGISFAIGALMANLFCHILPDIFQKINNEENHHHEHEHHHDHGDHHGHDEGHAHGHMEFEYGLNILFSFIFYYSLDKISDVFNQHCHSEKNEKKNGDLKNQMKKDLKNKMKNGDLKNKMKNGDLKNKMKNGDLKNGDLENDCEESNFGKNLTFYIMDIFHNMSDGLAIYTIFKSNPLLGVSLTFSFFWEEFFHQLSDYCILLKRGWKLEKIYYTQIFTSLFIFFGAFFGNALSNEFEIHLNLFVLVSLIYNIFSQIVPEIKEEKINLWFGIEILFLIIGFYSTAE